jgi:formate hydrogenlyase subunit 4
MRVIAALIQVGAIALAPLLPSLIQVLKARLQGRRGASGLQPYRTLRRLWSKSQVDPEGSGIVYMLAPPLSAACLLIAILIVPVGGRSGQWYLGNDAFMLIGLLALARFAVAAAAWDPGNGFALMGAARDLTFAVFGEALIVLAMLVAALPARGTNMLAMVRTAEGSHIWNTPAHWCGLIAFALVVLVETGRQPIDNPDTHLELTMIHEGPLLEYAGRDLALLQWTAAARHWVVLLLGAQLFLPQWGGFAERLVLTVAEVGLLCVLLALSEIAQAKLRILRVPTLLSLGCAIALAGAVSYVAGVGR